MNFEQTIGLTIAGLIVSGSAGLLLYDRKAFVLVGRAVLGVVIGACILAYVYERGYMAGASAQWHQSFREAGAIVPALSLVELSPIPGWAWVCALFVLAAELVMLTIEPLLRGHAERVANHEPASEPKERQ